MNHHYCIHIGYGTGGIFCLRDTYNKGAVRIKELDCYYCPYYEEPPEDHENDEGDDFDDL